MPSPFRLTPAFLAAMAVLLFAAAGAASGAAAGVMPLDYEIDANGEPVDPWELSTALGDFAEPDPQTFAKDAPLATTAAVSTTNDIGYPAVSVTEAMTSLIGLADTGRIGIVAPTEFADPAPVSVPAAIARGNVETMPRWPSLREHR